MVTTEYRHDTACSGCPICRAEFAELLRMTAAEASRFLKSRDRARTVRAGSRRFVNVHTEGGFDMPRRTRKDGSAVYVPIARAAAAPPRREPTVAERVARAATAGASQPIGLAEAELLRAQIRNAARDPWGLPPVLGLDEQVRNARETLRGVPRVGGAPDPWRLDEVRR